MMTVVEERVRSAPRQPYATKVLVVLRKVAMENVIMQATDVEGSAIITARGLLFVMKIHVVQLIARANVAGAMVAEALAQIIVRGLHIVIIIHVVPMTVLENVAEPAMVAEEPAMMYAHACQIAMVYAVAHKIPVIPGLAITLVANQVVTENAMVLRTTVAEIVGMLAI